MSAVPTSMPAAAQALLRRYLDELDRWNRRLNLSAVPAPDAWPRHVDESLALLDAARLAPGAAVVDVGSGAGVPGVVIAVVRPDLAVTLLEADARKAAFLLHVAGLLELVNVNVVSLRAEQAGRRPELREAFDLAASRAAARPAVLCELALPLVRVGGRMLALVTDAAGAATGCAAAAAACGGGTPTAAGAGLLSVSKIAGTGALYPRRDGVPARRPIA